MRRHSAKSGSSGSTRHEEKETYLEKIEDPSPEAKVGALAPPALVHDGSLVGAATTQVDNHSDKHTAQVSIMCIREQHAGFVVLHDTEHPGRTEPARMGIHGDSATCSGAADLKEIGARVHCTNEGCGCSGGGGIAIAEEGHHGGLSPGGVRLGARGAVGIIQDQLATAEKGV